MSRRPKQGDFLRQLASPNAKRSSGGTRDSKFTWSKPVTTPVAPTGAPDFNSHRSQPGPVPASDIPVTPTGAVDIAAVRARVAAASPKTNPTKIPDPTASAITSSHRPRAGSRK